MIAKVRQYPFEEVNQKIMGLYTWLNNTIILGL
jgi:hypothetical protein